MTQAELRPVWREERRRDLLLEAAGSRIHLAAPTRPDPDLDPEPDLDLCPAAGQAEAELKDFGPYYRRQFSIARFLQVEADLEQRKEEMTLLLMQKVPGRCSEPPEPSAGPPLLSTSPTLFCAGQEARPEAEVVYEENLLYFDEGRKWRDRYVVVRANHSLECHDSPEVGGATAAADVGRRSRLRPHLLSSLSPDVRQRRSSTPEAAAYRGRCSDPGGRLHGPGGQVLPRRRQ